jgi:hypothetical protein
MVELPAPINEGTVSLTRRYRLPTQGAFAFATVYEDLRGLLWDVRQGWSPLHREIIQIIQKIGRRRKGKAITLVGRQPLIYSLYKFKRGDTVGQSGTNVLHLARRYACNHVSSFGGTLYQPLEIPDESCCKGFA